MVIRFSRKCEVTIMSINVCAYVACECFTQEEGPFAHFSYLGRNITEFFKTGRAPYPVVRVTEPQIAQQHR